MFFFIYVYGQLSAIKNLLYILLLLYNAKIHQCLYSGGINKMIKVELNVQRICPDFLNNVSNSPRFLGCTNIIAFLEFIICVVKTKINFAFIMYTIVHCTITP